MTSEIYRRAGKARPHTCSIVESMFDMLSSFQANLARELAATALARLASGDLLDQIADIGHVRVPAELGHCPAAACIPHRAGKVVVA